MTHSLLAALLAALLLCSVSCSPLTSETDSLNSREELLDSSDYQYEEYDRVRDNRLIVDMEEVEQNKPQIKSSQLNLKRENLMNKTRRRRQVGGETGEEGSRESEPLLVEDPKGWGLAHVLGEALLSQISVRTYRLYLECCRNCLTGVSCYLHHRHHVQTHQDAHGDIRQGRPCLPQVQITHFYEKIFRYIYNLIRT